MGDDTWHSGPWEVRISFHRHNGRVGALARLVQGPMVAVGHGRASQDVPDADPVAAQALAAQRSLEDLGRSVAYLVESSSLSAADQA
jgi:hypothetical protein